MVATLEKTLSQTAIYSFDKGLDLFFYDANLEGKDNLVPYISENITVIPVESSESFLTKLSDYSSQKINNLYVLCHGQAGFLKIGSEVVNTEALNQFSENNSIYIEKITLLSCNVGQDIEFIKNLSETFNSVVNYSDKLVGHKSLGGSWNLNTYSNELVSNKIIPFSLSSLPFSAEVINDWEHTLAITISAGQVAALVANPSSISGYSASSTITITGQITAAEASTLSTVAATSIIATVAPAAATTLAGISMRNGRTNAFTLTPTDTSATASVLKSVKDITSLGGNFANVTTIAASPSADITALFAPLLNNGTSANTTFAADITINVNDTSIAAATLNAFNLLTTTAVVTTATTITGGATDVKSALGAGINHGAAVAVTITEASTIAGLLNDIDGLTAGRVTVQSTTLTGSAGNVVTALQASAAEPTANVNGVATPTGNTITGMGAINVTLTAADGVTAATVTEANVNDVEALTTGTITATLDTTALGDLLDNTNGLQNLDRAHNLTITSVADASISGAQMVALDAKTTVVIPIAAATVTGTYADIAASFASSGLSGLGSQAIAPTETLTATQANALNALTTGVITETVTGSMSTLAALTLNTDPTTGAQVVDGNGDAVQNAYTIAPTDTTATAAALSTLITKTSVDIDTSNITTITGTLAEVDALYAGAGHAGLGNEAVTISDTGSLDADAFQRINAASSGVVTVSGAVTNLTGSAANVAALFGGNAQNNGVVFTANPTVTVTGASAAVADVNTINGATSGLVTVNSATLTGSEADLNTALTAAALNTPTIAGIGAVNLTVAANDGVAIADLSTLTSRTTGVVTASITGGDITVLLAAAAAIETGHALSFTVTTSTATANIVSAADLISLNALTTAPITVTVTGSVTGSAADLRTVFAANTAKVGGAAPAGSQISGLELEPVTMTGTALTAEDILYVEGLTAELLTLSQVTHISGTAADLISINTKDTQNSPTIAGTANTTTVVVTDSTVTAANLNTINGTYNTVVTTTATTITGVYADLYTALLANNGQKLDNNGSVAAAAGTELLDGLDAVNVTFTSETSGEANTLEALTTGTISGTISDGGAAALLHATTGVTALSRTHNLTITVTDASVSAANITALDAKTSGTLTINSGTIVGSASELLAVYAAGTAGTVAGLGSEAITVTGGISVADFNTLATKTDLLITATVTTTDATTLKTLAESGHNLTITIADTTAAAADISAVDALTTGQVTVSSGTISGTNAELLAVNVLKTAGTTITAADVAKTITDPVTVAEANAIHALTDGLITATISDTTEAVLDGLSGTAGNANAYTITLSETSLVAADLLDVHTRTTVPLNASSVTTLRGTAAQILTVLVENSDFDTDYTSAKARTITGLDSVAVLPSAGQTATIAQIFGIEKLTTGLVTAVVTAAGVNQGLDHLMDTTTGIGLTNPNNAISVTVDDDGGSQTISAASLNTLNSRTTGLITVAVTAITGTVADLKTAFAANVATPVVGTQITGLEADTVTITYPGGAGVDTSLAATDFNILDAATAGAITASAATSLTGVGALTDDGNGNLVSAVRTALTSIGTNQGTWADANGAMTLPVTLTGNVTVAEANVYSGLTAGAVTATVSDGTMALLNTLRAEAGNAYTVTVTDTTADAGDLVTLDGKTTVAVNLAALTSISGDDAEIALVYAANNAQTPTVTGLGNEALTISGDAGGNPLTVAEINTTAALTTGVVTATIATGSMATLNAIAETGNALSFTVNDAAIDAATFNNLKAKTTGVVTIANNVINGTASDVAAIYEAQTAGTVAGLANETVTISDTGTVLVSDLNTIDAGTNVAVVATAVTGLSGTATAINTAYASAGITGLANEAVTVTGAASAADLTTVNTNTTGLVTVNSTAITGTYAQVVALYASNNGTALTGLGNEALTITDASLTVAQANAVDALTTAAVTATLADNDVDTLATLTGTGNAYSISITDATVSAANLNALNAKTTSAISVTSTSVSGSSTDLITAYLAQGSGVTGLGSETVTVTSGLATTATASALKLVGSFDATSYLASNTDVLAALGTNANTAHGHYIDYGYAETRSIDTFKELSYIASYSDLTSAFGANGGTAATAHYVNYGYSEGRSASFDELGYIASYTDLIAAFGSDTTAGTTHYINFGSTEGRTATFNAASYLAANADLTAAFGSNLELATKHYIDHGSSEGRLLA